MTVENTSRTSSLVVTTLAACLGAVCMGFSLGYSSSALLDLQSDTSSSVKFNKYQGSWFAALLNAGAIFGGPIGGWLIEYLGRKGGIMFCGAPFELGWLLIAYARNHFMLYFGRFCTGLGVGMVSVTVPVYIAEISSPRLRGALCSVNQLALTAGLLLSFSLGVVLKWRWLAITGGVFPALLVLLMFFMPETPMWSLSHHKRNDAIKALTWLKGPDIDTEDECSNIQSNLGEHASVRITFPEFKRQAVIKPLYITVIIMFFQQFSGVNAVLFNCASIFKEAGFENAKAVSIIVAAVQFFGTGIACLIMDKAGRRLLLWIAGIGMAVSLIALGVYFEIYIPKDGSATRGIIHGIHHSVDTSKISWLAILSLIVFFLSFAVAWGPIPRLLMSELFPLKARGVAGGISGFVNWLSGFIVTKTFVDFQIALTPPGTFLFYGCVIFAASVFVIFFLPETKGKTLEDIGILFDRKQKRNEYQRLL